MESQSTTEVQAEAEAMQASQAAS